MCVYIYIYNNVLKSTEGRKEIIHYFGIFFFSAKFDLQRETPEYFRVVFLTILDK